MTLVEATLAERAVPDLPQRLIGDKAYDSDRLDEKLMAGYGIEMIAPDKHHPHFLFTLNLNPAGIHARKRQQLILSVFHVGRRISEFSSQTHSPLHRSEYGIFMAEEMHRLAKFVLIDRRANSR